MEISTRFAEALSSIEGIVPLAIEPVHDPDSGRAPERITPNTVSARHQGEKEARIINACLFVTDRQPITMTEQDSLCRLYLYID